MDPNQLLLRTTPRQPDEACTHAILQYIGVDDATCDQVWQCQTCGDYMTDFDLILQKNERRLVRWAAERKIKETGN